MTIKVKVPLVLIVCVGLSAGAGNALAESCVAAVRALVPWATVANIPTTNSAADTMAANAKARGYKVDRSPSKCSASEPCILVYPSTYGSGINKTYGHVAVLRSDKDSKGKATIQDSKGICGGTRKTCQTTPKRDKVSVIHPK